MHVVGAFGEDGGRARSTIHQYLHECIGRLATCGELYNLPLRWQRQRLPRFAAIKRDFLRAEEISLGDDDRWIERIHDEPCTGTPSDWNSGGIHPGRASIVSHDDTWIWLCAKGRAGIRRLAIAGCHLQVRTVE